jgi:putative spermidine/putrescine transport system permease protein
MRRGCSPMIERFRRRSAPALLLLPTFALAAYVFVLPLLTFLRYSFYRFDNGKLEQAFVFDAYRDFLSDPYEHIVFADSLKLAALVTLTAVAIGYPLAYVLWRVNRPGLQKWLALLIFSPILVSVVVRSYGWTVLLADQGPVNFFLLHTGLAAAPVRLVYNLVGVVVSLTHVFLPFVVFPIFSTMVRLDPALREAAEDLGAGWWTTFRRVTFPLTLPGLIAAAQICFTLALGAFVTPAILGGGRVLILPLEIYQATTDINWPAASVGNVVLLLLAFVAVAGFNRLIRFSEV